MTAYKNSPKGRLMEQYRELWDTHFELNKRLYALCDEGKITSGCLLVYTASNNMGLNWIREIGGEFSTKYKRTSTGLIHSYLETAQEEYEKALKFVEEQEAATFETCQRTEVYRTEALKRDLQAEEAQAYALYTIGKKHEALQTPDVWVLEYRTEAAATKETPAPETVPTVEEAIDLLSTIPGGGLLQGELMNALERTKTEVARTPTPTNDKIRPILCNKCGAVVGKKLPDGHVGPFPQVKLEYFENIHRPIGNEWLCTTCGGST